MLKKISLILLLIICSQANAYLVTTYKSEKINYELPTRILVAGAGEDLGTQFQEVANGQALKYSQLYPDEQIVLIASDEPKVDDKLVLKNWGYTLQSENSDRFNGKTFLEEVVKFKKISSIDIFSHSSEQYGLYLDGRPHRLTAKTKGLEKLKGHFENDAYVILHGCNAGFSLAPYLSGLWEIPVAGALTSTNFQKLHNDGNFYLTEAGLFPNSDWAEKNEKSFDTEVNCKAGMCIRLKPDNHPYVGFWGEYADGGLPFYKFFCSKNSSEQCSSVMAKSLLAFIGDVNLKKTSSLVEFKKALVDFLCPVSAKKDIRSACEKSLEESENSTDQTYNPFTGNQVECDFKMCQAEIKCQQIIFTGVYRPGTCSLVNKFEGKATTLVREYKAYLEGFKSLNN